MYTTKLITKTFSLFALILFTVSFFTSQPTIPPTVLDGTSSMSTPTIVRNGATPADYPDNYTEVSWDRSTVNEIQQNDWNSSHYKFGPLIFWETVNATTEEVIPWDQEIPLNSWIDFVVEIPYSALSGQEPHAVGFTGQYFNLSEMNDGQMTQQDNHPIMMIGIYYVTWNRWEIYSSKDAVWPDGPPGELPENFTLSDVFGQMVEPYVEIDNASSRYVRGAEGHLAEFRIQFNSSILPGFYMFNAMAMDMNYQSFAESRQTEQSGRLLGMDLHSIVNQAFGGYYQLERLSDDGEPLYTANRGEDFNFTMTITNATLMSNATIHIQSPSTYETQKWVFGEYSVTTVSDGAWEWNAIAQTYIWNASAKVTWTEKRVGYHWEDTYTWVDNGITYPSYNRDWGWESREAWPEYAVSYNFQTNSFEYFSVYHFENQTYDGKDWVTDRWEEYYPWDSSSARPFNLNETTSRVYYNSLGKIVVDFRGHINDTVIPSGSEFGETLHVSERAKNVLNQELVNYVNLPIAPPNAAQEYEELRNLAVDTPVSIVRLRTKGESYIPDHVFQASIGETFVINSTLQGGIELADEIDGIAFVMTGKEEKWGRAMGIEWWQTSDIRLEIKIDPSGGIEIDVYNYTVRTQWGEGWHYEFYDVWLPDGRTIREEELVYGWFWQELIWDHNAADWTNQHFPMESLQSKMSSTFVTAGNVSYTVVDDDLKVIFDVTPQSNMPALEWRWDYYYGNLTLVVDYESSWDRHTLLGWTEDTVYHYWNGTDIVYVETPYQGKIFRNWETGELYERESIPYVLIDGTPEPIQSYIFGDFEHTYETFIREDYDYALDSTRRYMKWYNGSEVEVFGDQIVAVFNVTLNNGTHFLSFQNEPKWMGYQDYSSWIKADGSIIIGTWANDWWKVVNATKVQVVPVTMVDYTYVTYATPIGPFEPSKTTPVYMVGWPESVGPDHWRMILNGTWEPVDVFRYWEGDNLFYYHNHTDGGRMYIFEWPWELMECNYGGQKFIPHYATKLFAYVTINSVNHPIPNVGEPLDGWWNLDWIIRDKYSFEIAHINGTSYLAQYDRQEWTPGPPYGYWYPVYQVNVLGTLYNLTDWGIAPNHILDYTQFPPDQLPWISKANGSIFIPEIMPHGWTVAVGNTSETTLDFVKSGWLDLETGYFNGDYPSSQIWEDNGTHRFVRTLLGEEFLYNETWRATFHKITLANGTFFYSGMEHPYFEPTAPDIEHIEKFYMIDIFGNFHNWTGWMEYTSEVVVINNVTGYAWDGAFGFQDQWINITQYNVTAWWWDDFNWRWMLDVYSTDNVRPQEYHFLQAMNGSIYEVVPLYYTPESFRYNFPGTQFWHMGTWYNITGRSDMIYKAYTFEGHSKKLDYAPLPVSIIRSQYSIITGAPSWGMWDVDLWTIDPLSGALDLDGNLGTTNDQYFIKEYHSSSDAYNITHEYLDVTIYWEPDSSLWADEFYLHSFTGMVTFNWTFSWADQYIWTKADTGATLSTAEFNDVKSRLFDAWGNPMPGYWGISWMAKNFTSTDLLQLAIDEGWEWVPEGSQEWSWLWWELEESYSSGNQTDLMDIELAYQYAGMFTWNDTNSDNFMDISSASLGDAELTHYWMPIDVLAVNFTTPGEAWGNYNANDTVYRSVNETIDFGVTFINVTGEVFPFGDWSYFDWYEGQYHGSDFATFDERPTNCLTEEFSIDVHFTGKVNETGGPSSAEVKFDIGVGDWHMYTPGGIDVLEGRSLAVSFFSDLTITTSGGLTGNATYFDDYNQPMTNDQAQASSNFTMVSGASNVALMSLGGAPYDWSKNGSYPTFVDAQTVPLSAFSAIYLSGGGGTATTFSIASTQFYTVIGFPQWDGYAVTVDPIFVAYISPGQTDTDDPSFGTTLHSPAEILGVDNVHIRATVSDSGGSGLAEVKVWETGGDNYTMTFNEGLGVWEVNIPRTSSTSYTEGRFDFSYRIVAIDNAGNEAITSEQTFHFRDNIPPSIDSMGIVNGTDLMGDEIATVTATATDTGDSGIDRVVLTYQNTSGQYNVSMPDVAGSYTGEIPNHAPGTIVQYGVTVYDIDGNLNWSGWDTFTFWLGEAADVVSPSVTLVEHLPSTPGTSDAVTVSADIQDISGVASAVLQYNVDSGAWVNVTMTSVGTTYSAMIPTQDEDALVTYRIVAYDTIGNEAISPTDSYEVHDVPTTTTPTEPTVTEPPTSPTEPGPGPGDQETMFMIYGAFGALVVIVLALGARRRK